MSTEPFQEFVDAHHKIRCAPLRIMMIADKKAELVCELPRTKIRGSNKLGDPRLPRKNEHLMKAGRFMIRTPLTKAFIACLIMATHGIDARGLAWTQIEKLCERLATEPRLDRGFQIAMVVASHKVHRESGFGLSDLDGPIPVVLDALQAIGIVANDRQLVRLVVDKIVSPNMPGLAIEVRVDGVTTNDLDVLRLALEERLSSLRAALVARKLAQKPVRGAARSKR